MERLISPQPVSWPRLHLIPVSTWHPLVCAASQNPDKPGVKTQAAALAANGAAQISTCRSSAPLRGGAAGARGIDPIFWGEALTLGCSRSLPRSCSENLTFRATRGLPGVAEQDRDLSPAVAPLPPELTWLQGRRVLGQVHPTEPPLWAQTKAQRKVWLPTLLPLASPAAASPPGPFRGSFRLRTHKRGARDTVTRFRGQQLRRELDTALVLQEKPLGTWGSSLGGTRTAQVAPGSAPGPAFAPSPCQDTARLVHQRLLIARS